MNYCCAPNDMVEIIGLCDPQSIILDDSKLWTELSVFENLLIPEQKPDIEQIVSINISVKIIRKKVIVTPISLVPNEEGKNLTGRKLIIEGLLCQAVTYTANVPEQSVHTAHFAVPFSAYIVVPDVINTTDSLDICYQVNPCIEDVFIKECSRRRIFKNVTLLLQAIPKQLATCSCCN